MARHPETEYHWLGDGTHPVRAEPESLPGALLAALAMLGSACGGGSNAGSSNGVASQSAHGGSGKSRGSPFVDENGVKFLVSLQVPAQILSPHAGSVVPQGDELVVVPFTISSLEATCSEPPESLFLGRVLLKTSARCSDGVRVGLLVGLG